MSALPQRQAKRASDQVRGGCHRLSGPKYRFTQQKGASCHAVKLLRVVLKASSSLLCHIGWCLLESNRIIFTHRQAFYIYKHDASSVYALLTCISPCPTPFPVHLGSSSLVLATGSASKPWLTPLNTRKFEQIRAVDLKMSPGAEPKELL